MKDIRINLYSSLLNSDFIDKLQLIESANCAYSIDTFKNTQRVIDNIIISFIFLKDDSLDKIIDFVNPEYCNLRSKRNLLNLF